jgi:hypothetical protein
VLEGIQKRLDWILDPVTLAEKLTALLGTALTALERERAGLETRLAASRIASQPNDPRNLQAVAGRLVEALQPFRALLAEGTVEERRDVVRCFLAGIRIEKATRQATLRWFRLPRSLKLVELRGIEPLTPRLPASCSPS